MELVLHHPEGRLGGIANQPRLMFSVESPTGLAEQTPITLTGRQLNRDFTRIPWLYATLVIAYEERTLAEKTYRRRE